MKVKIHKCRNIIHPFPVLAWLIMFFQRMSPLSPNAWSHMSLEFDGEFFDVTGSGFNRRRPEDFLESYRIVETHELEKDILHEEFYYWISGHSSVKYDYLQLGGLLLKALGYISFNMIGRNYKSMTCNELVLSHIVRFYGLEVSDPDDYDLIMTWKEVTSR